MTSGCTSTLAGVPTVSTGRPIESSPNASLAAVVGTVGIDVVVVSTEPTLDPVVTVVTAVNLVGNVEVVVEVFKVVEVEVVVEHGFFSVVVVTLGTVVVVEQ
jgi:hypothetical protein